MRFEPELGVKCLPLTLFFESFVKVDGGLLKEFDDLLHLELGVLVLANLAAIGLRPTFFPRLDDNPLDFLFMLPAFNLVLQLLLMLLENGLAFPRIVKADKVECEVVLIDLLVVQRDGQELLVEKVDRLALQCKGRLWDLQLFSLLWRHCLQELVLVLVVRIQTRDSLRIDISTFALCSSPD